MNQRMHLLISLTAARPPTKEREEEGEGTFRNPPRKMIEWGSASVGGGRIPLDLSPEGRQKKKEKKDSPAPGPMFY